MKKYIFTILIIFLNSQIFAQAEDIGLHQLQKFIKAENISDSLRLENITNIYKSILKDVYLRVNEEEDIYDKHEALWDILHEKYLLKYVDPAYLSATLSKGEYNCVTATILYYVLGIELNLPTIIIETPHHVYLNFIDDDKSKILIELTSPKDGFDYKENVDDYIDYLLEYEIITKKELEEKGKVNLYNEFVLESKPIEINRLISIYYGNLIAYKLDNDESYSAVILGFKSIKVRRDSMFVKGITKLWNNHVIKIYNNNNELYSFIIESMKYNSVSLELEESIINASTLCIEGFLSKSEFANADTLFAKVTDYIKYFSNDDEKLLTLKSKILMSEIYSDMMLGNYQKGLNLAQSLFQSNPLNLRYKEIYVSTARQYLQNNVSRLKYEEVKEILDNLLNNLPEVKSIHDLYAGTILLHVFTSGLNSINPKKSEKILLDAYDKIPNNTNLKSGLGHLYHGFAMSEIRISNYKKAVKFLKKGLKYDPLNQELLHELKLTNDLVKSGAR